MRKMLIVLTAPALLIAALPAQGQTVQNNVQSPASDRGAASSEQRRNRADPDRRICVDLQLSGSHVTRRVCRTAREWQDRGEFETDD